MSIRFIKGATWGDAIRSGYQWIVHTIGATLWIVFLCIAGLTLLTVLIRLAPHFRPLLNSIIARLCAKREEARLRRLLERQQLLADQRVREARERVRCEEQARQKQKAEEALRKAREQKKLVLCLENWQADAAVSLSNRTIMVHFPEPQLDACDDCRVQRQQNQSALVLRICLHNLKKLLLVSGDYETMLKGQQRMWHPDRFRQAPESARVLLVKKATEMSSMINALIQDERDQRNA